MVYILLCVGRGTMAVGSVVPKLGVLWHVKGCKMSLSAMQMPIRPNWPNFRIPYFHHSKCRPYTVPPGAHAPFTPPSCCHWLLSPFVDGMALAQILDRQYAIPPDFKPDLHPNILKINLSAKIKFAGEGIQIN